MPPLRYLASFSSPASPGTKSPVPIPFRQLLNAYDTVLHQPQMPPVKNGLYGHTIWRIFTTATETQRSMESLMAGERHIRSAVRTLRQKKPVDHNRHRLYLKSHPSLRKLSFSILFCWRKALLSATSTKALALNRYPLLFCSEQQTGTQSRCRL